MYGFLWNKNLTNHVSKSTLYNKGTRNILFAGVKCSEGLPGVHNASINLTTSSTYRGVGIYACHSGLHPTGSPVTVCLNDGTWSAPDFICTSKLISHSYLKLPGRDGSWIGDYATCGSCHLAHAARFALAPRLLQRYDRWVSRTN